MQLMVYINLEEPITLPLNYNHIVQAIIYRALGIMPDYADFLHDGGYMSGTVHGFPHILRYNPALHPPAVQKPSLESCLPNH